MLNIESQHINAVNRQKHYHSTLILLCFRQDLDKKVGISCAELSTKQLDQLEWHFSAQIMVTPWVKPRLCIAKYNKQLSLK